VSEKLTRLVHQANGERRTSVARKHAQFFLADLVAIVALCALFLGLIQSTDPRGNVAGFLFSMWMVVIAWMIFRARRDAPTCDECGRRFIAQQKKMTSPPLCPQCGQPHRGPARTRIALAIGFWAVVALLVLSVLLMTSVRLDASTPLSSLQISLLFGVLPILMMLLCGLLIVLMIARAINDGSSPKRVGNLVLLFQLGIYIKGFSEA
jgi:hypothetical protein